MRIVLVGAGRLGRTLAPLLRARGHDVALWSRADGLPEPPLLAADLVWLCVPDAAVAAVARGLPEGPVVLHASGALDVDALGALPRRGSLHPLMTFPGPEIAIPDLRGVPAAVAGDAEAVRIAREVAASLGLVPFEVHGDRRLYHAAAVMAGNFATVLLTEAARVLAAAGVPPADCPRILEPLALRSVANAATCGASALTGPAARGDHAVLDAHRAALDEAGLDAARGVYDALTAVALAHRKALAREP